MAIADDPAREIVTTRLLHAPVAEVFRAWTAPEHLCVWWGPAGFTNTFHVFDLRVGGRWKFTMHGPEKGHYENEVEFTAIGPPYHLAWKRLSQPLFGIDATFEPMGDMLTRLTWRMIFDTAEECAKLRPYVVEKNEENMDRLEAELVRMAELLRNS
jgi:uncharacterized protein YndB with AHSA1/START domain